VSIVWKLARDGHDQLLLEKGHKGRAKKSEIHWPETETKARNDHFVCKQSETAAAHGRLASHLLSLGRLRNIRNWRDWNVVGLGR